MYNVPTEKGVKQLALIKGASLKSLLGPETKQRITWQGSWRSLNGCITFDARWSNYPEASKQLDFIHYFRNTMIVSILATIGTVISGVMVAYGWPDTSCHTYRS